MVVLKLKRQRAGVTAPDSARASKVLVNSMVNERVFMVNLEDYDYML